MTPPGLTPLGVVLIREVTSGVELRVSEDGARSLLVALLEALDVLDRMPPDHP